LFISKDLDSFNKTSKTCSSKWDRVLNHSNKKTLLFRRVFNTLKRKYGQDHHQLTKKSGKKLKREQRGFNYNK
jgi:uncharacterized protein YjcR